MVIPPPKNAVIRPFGIAILTRSVATARIAWQAATGYKRRSRIETQMDRWVCPWRVIFERDEEARKIDVLRIGPRGDVYQE